MTFSLGKLRGTQVYKDLEERCRSYSVLISPIPDLRKGGSGTLVKYKGMCGILTATHVMARHLENKIIFSPLKKTSDPTYFLNIPIPIKKIIYLETEDGIKALQEASQGKIWPEGALDICLIQLDPSVFDRVIEISGKKAVDLLEHKTKYEGAFEKYCDLDRNHDWSWAVNGAPREGSIQNNEGVLESKFDGLYVCGGAKEGSTYKTQQLTLVVSPYDGSADIGCHDLGPTEDRLPDNFKGMSGAGMWQVGFGGKDGMPETIEEMFFSGVFVAGIPQQCLYSRGPDALYTTFVKYLDVLNSEQEKLHLS